MEFARSRGWYFKKTSDHSWAHIVCRIGVVNPSSSTVCDIPIFSSARGGESAAKTNRNKVRNCSHVEQPLGPEAAMRILDVSESLLDSAEQILNGIHATEQALEELLLADGTLREAEALDRAVEAEATGNAMVSAGAEAAKGLGADPGEPPDVSPVLEGARERLGEAHYIVRGSPAGLAKQVRARIEALRVRYRDLLKRAEEQSSA